MVKKTIKYVDFNGKEREEDFYFNISKAEAAEMELSEHEGLAAKFRKIVASEDRKEIINVFKDIILKSYGVKSEDGKRFMKSQEIRDAFAQTEAYSNLFIELATNADAASNFVNGIIPDLSDIK